MTTSGTCDGLVWPDGETAVDLATRHAASFGTEPGAEVERFRARADRGEIAAWVLGGRVVAQSRVLAGRRWIGGRTVGTWDIASVAVAPQDRGQGHARALTEALAVEGARRGYGLSLLFPATTRLYRSLGWELSGAWTWFDVPARSLPTDGPAMRGATDADWPAIRECHERAARRGTGPAVRSDERWEALRRARWPYVLDAAPDAEGDPQSCAGLQAYVLIDHEPLPDHWQHRVVLTDWAALSSAGQRAILTLAGRQATTGRDVRYRAPLSDPWLLFLPEQTSKRVGGLQFMARALDLRACVAERGWPSAVRARIVLRVEDRLLPSWSTPHLLEVDGGDGRLEPAPDREPEVVADARALGPLLLGFHDPDTLVAAGLLRGRTSALEALAAACAGPQPTLLDFF